MQPIRIVHISDPHFGSMGQTKVWNSANNFLNETIRPHLVLVTGDIVHTPDDKLYEAARTELCKLERKRLDGSDVCYRVCAGNHDRHPVGIAPGPLKKVYRFISSWEKHPANFSEIFAGRIPTVGNPHTFELSEGENVWKVRVIAFDTSAKAKYTAQGFAEESDWKGLAGAASGKQSADLVILMHHHHLLSIKELECKRQALKNLFTPTIMLNAGTVLEALAEGSVNIVLHGHEHFRMFARYGTISGEQNDTVIVGAGSVTGNDSIEGCQPERASFNIIELRPDFSVYVQEIGPVLPVHGNTMEWEAKSPPRLLLDGRAIRRSRFFRQRDGATFFSPPNTKIVKCVEFHADRSVDVTQTWLDWSLNDGKWATTTTNSSGLPSRAYVRFDWPEGGTSEYPEQEFESDQKLMHTYRLDLRPKGEKESKVGRITLRFRWMGGAVLTKSDLTYFDHVALDEFRKRGQEFWAIHTRGGVVSISLLVRLPSQFAPEPQDVRIYGQQWPGGHDLVPEPGAAVQHYGPGIFLLQIPYPRPNFRYSIVWPLPDGPPPSAVAENFRRVAKDTTKAEVLLKTYATTLERSIADTASFGLYIPYNSTTLIKTGAFRINTGGAAIPDIPDSLSLRNDHRIHRQAWWGTVQAALGETGDPGFAAMERAVIIVPIRLFGRDDDETWGLIRIGIPARHGPGDDELQSAFGVLEKFTDGIPSVIQEAKKFTDGIPSMIQEATT